jgi:signal transduction histidine kinase
MSPATTGGTVGLVAMASLPALMRKALAGPRADIALALALSVFAVLDVLLSPEWRGPAAVNVVVVPATALSLAWRRKRPLTVLAVVLSGYVGLSLAFGATQSWSFTFIVVTALYSAVVYGSRPLLAAALATVGVVAAYLTDPLVHGFGDAVWGPSLIVLTVGIGLTGRAIRARTSALEHRAEALDLEEQRRAAAAAAEERRRIARELHDIISHSLGVVVLQAGAAERVLDSDPARAREVLESIRATGQEAIGEMGTLLGLLNSSPGSSREPQPSLADLDGLVSRMRDAGLSVELAIEGQQRVLPAALELSAFRVMQEGLTNSLKHASATHVRAVLRYGEAELEVDVSDDGVTAGNGAGARRGLAGTRERVEVFGGKLEAGPRPGGGWRLHATFPVLR